jgi:hypothetical protein
MPRPTRLFAAIAAALLLLPAVPANAAAICACYYGDPETCEYYYDEAPYVFATNTNECNLWCLTPDVHPDTDRYEWAQNSDSEDGITVGADCLEAAKLAETTEETAEEAAADPPTSELKPTLVPRLSVDIPDLSFAKAVEDSGYVTSNFIGTYVSAVYSYLITISVIIAIVFVMIGGIQYVVGATTGEIGKAKARITNAVSGLVLLLFVYTILFVVNPRTAFFPSLELMTIKEVPAENFFDANGPDSMACTAAGADLTGVNPYQDCMLANYGATEEEVRSHLVPVKYRGRTYQVHNLMKADFEAALAAIDASLTGYDITWDTAGGTFNWRCNKNDPRALSPHAWAGAIDVNPSLNPNCPKECRDKDEDTACSCIGGITGVSCETMCATDYHDIPTEVVNAFKNNHFNWGGEWRGTARDWMHFSHSRICLGG